MTSDGRATRGRTMGARPQQALDGAAGWKELDSQVHTRGSQDDLTFRGGHEVLADIQEYFALRSRACH